MAPTTIDRICIEGNIGAGKSELLRSLEMHGYSVRQEPVDRWRPFLNRVNNCGQGIVALQTRIVLDTGVTPAEEIIERSPELQMPVFVEAALEDGSITKHEAGLMQDLMDRVAEWRPTSTIYLRADPSVCYQRILQRGRLEEEGLTLDGIRRLDRLYEAAVRYVPGCTVVDANQLQQEVLCDVIDSIKTIQKGKTPVRLQMV